MKITREQRRWKGRHRWSGDKSALVVLGSVVAVAMAVGATMWAVGSGSAAESPQTNAAADTSTQSSGSDKGPRIKKKPDYTPGKNPHEAETECGDGFEKVAELPVESDGTKLGSVHLLHDSEGSSSCVITLKAVDIGSDTKMSASLTAEGGESTIDEGSFSYFAGPVRRDSNDNNCVQWGGSIDGVTVEGGDLDNCG